VALVKQLTVSSFYSRKLSLTFPIAVGTQGQLQQVMSHADAGIFQAYMNERIQCDVQAAFLGRPSADALFKAMSHMSRHIDPRAPTQLSEDEVGDLKTHPLIVELRQRRDTLSAEARRIYGTLKKAEGAKDVIYALYDQAGSSLKSAKERLRTQKLKESRAEFFDKIETKDAEEQLERMALGVKEEEWQPAKVLHSLPERKLVADLLCASQSAFTAQETVSHRAAAIDALVSLGRRKQIRERRTAVPARDWGILPRSQPEQVLKNDQKRIHSPMVLTDTDCIFCICKTGQRKSFSRARKAREHVEYQHLRFFRDDDIIPCPDPYCRGSGVVIFGLSHFKNHVLQVHKCSLLPYSLQYRFH
jgi:hypothetical protein